MKKESDPFKGSIERRRRAVTEMTKFIIEGVAPEDQEDYLMREYELDKDYISSFIFQVKREIARTTGKQANMVVSFHIEAYERIYRYFNKIDFTPGKLKALRLKEKLMGLHPESNTIEINNKRTTIIEKDVIYNTELLNSKEKERLNYLIEKAK